MATEKEALNVLLGTAYKIPPEQMAALYKKADDDTPTEELVENAHEIILSWDAERVAKLATPQVNIKEHFDKGYNEGKGKTAQQWEKMIRAEYPDVDKEGKLQGDSLIKAIKAAMVSKAQDPEAVKMSSEYLQLETSMREQLEAKEAEYQTKLQTLETEFTRKQQWAEISKELRAEFVSMGPVLPSDAGKAQRLTDDFISKFSDYQFQRTDDGQTLVLKPDGTRLNNIHGHAVYLPDLVKQIGDLYFEFQKQPPVGSSGNQNDGRRTVTVKFKDENDFLSQYHAATTDDAKEVLAKAWEAQQAG